MSRRIHAVENLLFPFRFIEERLLNLPPGGILHINNWSYKILFFFDVDHEHRIEGCAPYRLKPGDAVVLPIRVRHSYHPLHPGRPSSIRHLRIRLDLPLITPGSASSQAAPRASSPKGHADIARFLQSRFTRAFHLPGFLTQSIDEKISLYHKEAESQPLGYELRVSSICLDLAIECVRAIYNSPPPPPDDPRHNKAPHIVKRAKEIILDNYTRPLTLEQIAWQMKLSREHLARIFRQTTGETVFQYLLKFRIEQARRLLSDADLSITQIAERTGFSSPTLFGRNFKKVTGRTPQEYRTGLYPGITFAPTSIKPGSVRESPPYF